MIYPQAIRSRARTSFFFRLTTFSDYVLRFTFYTGEQPVNNFQ